MPHRISAFLRRRGVWLAAAVAWTMVRWAHGGITDDAFITFAYARTLLETGSLAFYPGAEAVYGTTVPLFAVFVAAGMALGFAPWVWVLAWDGVWLGLILWKTQDILENLGQGRWFGLVAAVWIVGSPATLPLGGMETGLFCALIAGVLAAVDARSHPGRVLAWATAAAALRPDGAILWAIALAYAAWWAWKNRAWRGAFWAVFVSGALLGLLGGLWLHVFADWMPHSVRAKAIAAHDPRAVLFRTGFTSFFLHYWGAIQPLAIAGAALCVWHYRHPRTCVPAFVTVYGAVYCAARAPYFHWYLTPLVLPIYAAAVVGLGSVIRTGLRRMGPSTGLFAQPAALVAVLLLWPQVAVFLRIHGREFRSLAPDTNQTAYRDAARWVARESQSADPPPFLAAHEIGSLAYFSGLPAFDLEGLVTPEAVVLRRAFPGESPLARRAVPWFVHPFDVALDPAEDHPFHRWLTECGYREAARYPCSPEVTIVFHGPGQPPFRRRLQRESLLPGHLVAWSEVGEE
ncbi:MAG: hypothetical protein RLY93_06965 [Sumerlaeia bacterium]